MLAKAVFGRIMNRLKQGAVEVTYWDDEVKVYGPGKPYFKMKIKDEKTLGSVLSTADLGFGEAYADGRIEIEGGLDQVTRLVCENQSVINQLGSRLQMYRPQRNVKDNQAEQIAHHYDLGNDFYQRWLDKTMTYTCAYFKAPKDSLENAQRQKIEHVLRKAQLEPGQSLVDMGCGWGHLVVTAAKIYGAEGLGVTLSKEQHRYAQQLAKDEKLSTWQSLNCLTTRTLQSATLSSTES
jgi:cyclopropane-fatty-acyl-phospholipid synthase